MTKNLSRRRCGQRIGHVGIGLFLGLALAVTTFSVPAHAGWTNCSLSIAGGATWTTTLTPACRERATNDKNISWYKNANSSNQMPGGEYGLSGWTYLGGGKTVDFTIYPQLFQVSGALYGMRVQLANSAFAMREDSDTIYVDLDNPAISTPTDDGAYSSSSSLTFHWTASDGTSGISNYYMAVGTTPGGTDKYAGWIGSQPGSYTITGCADNTTYYCTMLAQDVAGRNSGLTASSDGIKVDLTNPTVYTPTPVGYYQNNGGVTFNFWGADAQSGIAGYYYEISPDSSFAYTVASGTTSGSSYTYGSPVQGVTYYCRTKAVDNSGRISGYSSTSIGVRVDSVAPSAPSAAPSVAVDHDFVTFYWPEASDPGYDTGAGVGVTGYTVQIKDDQNNYVVNGDVMTQNFYKFKGTVGRTYTCRVQSFDGAGNHSAYTAYSDGASVVAASPSVPATTVTTAQTDFMRAITTGTVATTWPGISEAQSGSVADKARNFENLTETYNLKFGQIVNIWYTDYTRSSAYLYDGCGDGASWLGSYLGVLANEFAVTGEPVTLSKLNSALNVVDMLTRCTKKYGYLARFAGPTSNSAYQQYYSAYGNGAYTCEAPWQDYTYLGYSSRDPYTGVAFGLTAAWKYGDSATSAKAKVLIERIIDRLVNDNWDIVAPAPGGQTTYNAVAFGWKAMWKRLGLAVNPTKYADFDSGTESYANLYASAMAVNGFDMFAKDYSDYFANYLGSEQLWVLINTDPNTTRKAALLAKLQAFGESDHLQASFASMYMNAAGSATSNIGKGTLQGCLLDFQSGTKWQVAVDQTSNPEYPYHNGDNTLSLTALLVHDRPLGDVLWQIKPGKLAGGSNIAYEWPALDMLLPYWQGRVVGAFTSAGPDTTAPIVTILGKNPARVGTANTYTDAGATAMDSYDGNVTSSIVTTNGVNNAVPGTYSVSYDAHDAAGNHGTAQRVVDVVSGSIPVITLSGNPIVLVQVGTSYTDAGATAYDQIDGNITGSIVTDNPVNVYVTGTYTVTYDVTSSTNNAADQVARTVVVYQTAPVTGKRVLVVGDSWAQCVWDSRMVDEVCSENGHSEFTSEGSTTAIGGTTAEMWATNYVYNGVGFLDRISAALTANPTIDIVYLSLGGNDMWDAGNDGWCVGIDPTVWTQHKANIKANVTTVVNLCLAQRANIKVVIAGYDYLNLWDTILQDTADYLMWQLLGSPTPAQINGAFVEAAAEIRQIALDNPTRVKYVQNFGLMQWWKNSPSGAVHPGTIANNYSPWPGGNSAYPTPMSALGGTTSNRDAIHLSTGPDNWWDSATNCGYGKLVQNVYDQVLAFWLLN